MEQPTERVKVVINGVVYEVNRGTNLLEVFRELGIPIRASCGGLGLCGSCKVRILRGYLNPPSESEVKLLRDLIEEGWRLACRVRVTSDLELEVPIPRGIEAVERIRRHIRIDPYLRIVPLGILKRTREPAVKYLERAIKDLGIEFRSISTKALGKVIRKLYYQDEITLVVTKNGHVLDIPRSDRILGVGIDLGTTTVVGSLIDLTVGNILGTISVLNAQVKYGEDIISRIRHALSIKGFRELREAILDTVNSLITRLTSQIGVNSNEVYEVAIAGNTVMTSILLNIPPLTLGTVPFEPPFIGGTISKAKDLGLNVNSEALVHTLPIIGGYIGGDVVGDILASGILEDKCALLIDFGTNGEVIVKSGSRIVATSVPSGPAFEGVGISSGMIAVEGAIESIRLDSDLNPEYEVIGGIRPKGICGTGYVDLLSELIRSCVINRSGRFIRENSERIRSRNGVTEYVIEWSENTATGGDIVITQKDIRKLQLVVAAFKVACKDLMKKLNITIEDIDRVYIAGSFGYKLNAENAMEIGLLPPVELENVIFIGNGSLRGAEIYLISNVERSKAKEIGNKVEIIDLHSSNFQRTLINELYMSWRT